MKKKMILGALAILMLLPVHAQIAWKQVEPGVWKGVVGTPEDYSLLDVAAVTPLKESFARLPEVALPALANEIVETDFRKRHWMQSKTTRLSSTTAVTMSASPI